MRQNAVKCLCVAHKVEKGEPYLLVAFFGVLWGCNRFPNIIQGGGLIVV
jgi:hypothetical protein